MPKIAFINLVANPHFYKRGESANFHNSLKKVGFFHVKSEGLVN